MAFCEFSKSKNKTSKLSSSAVPIKHKYGSRSRSLIKTRHLPANHFVPFYRRWEPMDIAEFNYVPHPKLPSPPTAQRNSVYSVILGGIKYFVVKKLNVSTLEETITVGFIDVLYKFLYGKNAEWCLGEGMLSEGTKTIQEAKILIAKHFREVKGSRILNYSRELKQSQD